MKWESLLQLVSGQSWFDLPLLAQVSGENRRTLLVQLSRWSREGKLVALRRGMYTLNPIYRRTALSVPQVANILYTPSYLTGIWCLGFYGLVPEKVVAWTSVTTRVTRTFENALGHFRYQQVKPELFRGFESKPLQGVPVRIATPEKAMCDFLYLSGANWDRSRLEEMRFQHIDMLDVHALRREAGQGYPPRVRKTVDELLRLAEEAQGGGEVI